MRILLVGVVFVIAIFVPLQTNAGWGDFFDKALSKGKEVLGNSTVSDALSDSDISGGLKEALIKGANSAVSNLGKVDGFSG